MSRNSSKRRTSGAAVVARWHAKRWLVLAVAALVLVACGSGDSSDNRSSSSKSSSGSSGKLSEAQLTAKVEKVCRDAEQENKRLPRLRKNDFAGFEAKYRALGRAAKEATGKLRDLTPPDALASQYAAFVEVADDQAELAGELADTAKARDANRLRALVPEAREVGAEIQRLAPRLRFKDCFR